MKWTQVIFLAVVIVTSALVPFVQQSEPKYRYRAQIIEWRQAPDEMKREDQQLTYLLGANASAGGRLVAISHGDAMAIWEFED
jgi:hypothetical protein